MPCLVIYGATGMGKTRIIQKFLRDNRTHFDQALGRTRLPVVSIQMPPSPSERDLYEELLAAMGGIFTYGTSVTTLRHRIRSLARQLEVRLLMIDEIHYLLAGSYCEQRILLNAIRFFANDLRLVCFALLFRKRSELMANGSIRIDRVPNTFESPCSFHVRIESGKIAAFQLLLDT
jgi:Cdc6-like AAA superfamily ATPase